MRREVAGSEGWWQCVLHGRSGLAPANRLQLLPDTQTPFPKGPKDACSDLTCQVPTGPVYEHMRSWVEGPRPACTQVYDLPASARLMCEKTLLSLPQQVRGAGTSDPNPQGASLNLTLPVPFCHLHPEAAYDRSFQFLSPWACPGHVRSQWLAPSDMPGSSHQQRPQPHTGVHKLPAITSGLSR